MGDPLLDSLLAPFNIHSSSLLFQSPDSTSLSKITNPDTIVGGPMIAADMEERGDEEEEEEGEDKEEGLHSTAVIVSTNDAFVLKQDLCMCCGSFGKGPEGYLISCVQCGQCFHPFCVNVKVKGVVSKFHGANKTLAKC